MLFSPRPLGRFNNQIDKPLVINLNTYNPRLLVQSIAKTLHTKTDTNYTEEVLTLPNKYGEGRILGFNFSDGVGLLLFDCTFKETVTIIFETPLLSSLLFNFISTGCVSHISNHENNHFTLSPLQGTISANPIDSPEAFVFPAKESVVYSCITVDRQSFQQKITDGMEKMPDKVKSVFLDIATEKSFFFQTTYSMASSIHLQSIINNEHLDLAGSIYLEGITLELLSSLVKQFKNSASLSSPKRTILSNEDIKKVLAAKDILLENMQKPLTVEELSKEVGINQTKLKIGFKNIFDTPIKTWLRNKKLEIAQLLLLKDQENIKEISERVGYLNQSHFSKQFKNRYGVLPKDYLKQIKKARTFDF